MRFQNLFPNHIYYFFYRYRPQKEGSCLGMCPVYILGEVEIRRGVDQDFCFDRSLCHSIKTNNFVEMADEFTLLKLLPWETKLQWLVKNKYDNSCIELMKN